MRVDTRCGCHLKPETLEIKYCPLHGAAPEMLEELERLAEALWWQSDDPIYQIIAKAKGKV